MTGEELYRRVNNSEGFGSLPEHLRAVWDMRARSFPFARSPKLNTDEIELPPHPPWAYALACVIRKWSDFTGQLPGGPTRVRNSAVKNGWEVRVRRARGVWQSRGKAFLIDPAAGPVDDTSEEDETDETAAGPAPDKIPALYEVIAVHGQRGHARVAATWIRKPWTKVGASGGWEFQGAHIWPAHLNGGLHNSNVLTKYLKSEEA